jgi:hypothetical protein
MLYCKHKLVEVMDGIILAGGEHLIRGLYACAWCKQA